MELLNEVDIQMKIMQKNNNIFKIYCRHSFLYSKYYFYIYLIDENVTINKQLIEIDNKNKKKSILILEQEKKSFKFSPEINILFIK